MNKRGRLVSERLAYGEAMIGEAPEMAEWLDDGAEIVAELRAAMHGEIDPRTVEEARIRHWQKYGRGIESGALAFGQPAINDWLRANPEAAETVARNA